MGPEALDVARVFDGARIVVLGGTGFLGKIFWSMLLDRYPAIARIVLVVRPKAAATPDARFWAEIAPSEALGPLRRAHGERFESFLREKIVAVRGDMGEPLCGLTETLIRELKGTIDAVVNVAGIVDFNPPLDDALAANAFGAQNLVGLARALGDVPVLHTSTCYVAGTRPGPIREEDPRLRPFPRSDELGAHLWDPDREIAECLNLVAEANHRSEDAFRQSEFAERARTNLSARSEPSHGPAYDAELGRVKRKFVRDRLIEAGLDRATHWGWPNIYLYTKAIGEQVIARSGLEFSIARPACCESCVSFPERGYNEGVNTSAPLIYLMMKGELQVLAQHVPLDLVPTDYVVAGMIVALAELLEGTARPVYQFGASDVNPCTAARFGELVGLYKRKYYRRKASGHPLWNALQARFEPAFVDRARFDATGAPAIAHVTRELASLARRAGPGLGRAAAMLEHVARREEKVAEVQRLFEPFAAKANGPFDCTHMRQAHGRLSSDDKRKLPWAPESIDWADWMMNVHMPAMEKRIVPEMDRKLKKAPKPLVAHGDIASLVDDMAERHGVSLALQMATDEGLTRITFADVKDGSNAVASRLAALGVMPGDRVVLCAQNHPNWAIAYFGIIRAGAIVVPVDPALDVVGFNGVLLESGARGVIGDDAARLRDAAASDDNLILLDIRSAVEPGDELPLPTVAIEPTDPASIVFTAGPSGGLTPSVITHANFTSMIAGLAPVFPLKSGDAVVSVLPLHHTFEFTCGLLLPFSRGARVVYVGAMRPDQIGEALRACRARAMVGVPALWQLIEQRILRKVDEHGPLVRAAFNTAMEANRFLSANVGSDLGRVLFGPVHTELGGNIRWLLSGGAALPRETQDLFAGIGLRVIEQNLVEPLTAVEVLIADSEKNEARPAQPAEHTPSDGDSAIVLPEPVKQVGKMAIGKILDVFYGSIMKPSVFGRSHIPHNRAVIVVANHASHLDMGLVRHALGKYGEDIVSLAAQDYFFESGIKRAFFENLTNLKPIDRSASLRQSIRQAAEIIEQGKTVLVFPEGTRSLGGEIQEFKPLAGYLALAHGVDILPIHLGGTHAAMSKGTVVPLRREIVARIGPPLRADDLRRLTGAMAGAPAARKVARIARAAVVALSEGRAFAIEDAWAEVDSARASVHPLVTLFAELEAKFCAGELEGPVSYYVSLGNDEQAKWTVSVDRDTCQVRTGKPESGQADCVLKTSPEMFTRIVRDAYTPTAGDFLSGAVKSNDVALLLQFQRAFGLDRAM